MNSNEKTLVRLGLELRDKLAGHHFIQARVGTQVGDPDVGKSSFECRDCGLRAAVDPEVWLQWVTLWLDTPENVRRVLDRPACV